MAWAKLTAHEILLVTRACRSLTIEQTLAELLFCLEGQIYQADIVVSYLAWHGGLATLRMAVFASDNSCLTCNFPAPSSLSTESVTLRLRGTCFRPCPRGTQGECCMQWLVCTI